LSVAVSFGVSYSQLEAQAFGCGLVAVVVVGRVGKLALLRWAYNIVPAIELRDVLARAVIQAGVYRVGVLVIAF
jgi:hypothetical protein